MQAIEDQQFLQAFTEIFQIEPQKVVAEQLAQAYALWKAAQPQWRPGEWGQDTTILRKYALDDQQRVWVMDLPDLP